MLPESIFHKLPNLLDVCLENIRLKKLFRESTKLTHIDFKGNSHLKKLEVGTFDGLVNLTHLTLNSNHLENLDKFLFKPEPKGV